MSTFHAGSRHLQDLFDSRRLADRIDDVLVCATLSPHDVATITAADHFFLATVAPDGFPTVSYKGGAPGFVRVLDDATLAFPHYDGNGMFLSAGNILGADPGATAGKVGMLFVDWERRSRMRVHGEATIDLDDPLTADYPEARFVVRVTTTAVFPNCPRYLHRMQRVERSAFVPEAGRRTPVPGWKRDDWARDVLPADDPARDPDAPVV